MGSCHGLSRVELDPCDAPLETQQLHRVGADPYTYTVHEHTEDSQQVWNYCLLLIPP